MDFEHWYRCTVCGYMYTPQQVQALLHILSARDPAPDAPAEGPVTIPCRKKGCPGTLSPTDEIHRDVRR